tara:strand:- start:1264 stop:1758 length:495 start_codon:yes stop_codon:yes gene_type:complete
MTDVTVIDSFLDKSDLEDLKSIVLSDYFPWYLNDGVSFPGDGEIQLTHTTFKDGNFVSSYTLGGLDIFKEKLNFQTIIRAKFNLLNRTPTLIEHGLHTDIQDTDNAKTAILYLNTNDGYTRFEDGKKIESVENRLVLFDANIKHGGTSCTNKRYRAVFNLNYKI